jgi:WD40 repeat protein
VRSVAFSPDGTAAKIWSVADGRLLGALEGHAGPVNALCWTDDGRVVSGSPDGTVRVWDAAVSNDRVLRIGNGAPAGSPRP